jgi:hypothetical protein
MSGARGGASPSFDASDAAARARSSIDGDAEIGGARAGVDGGAGGDGGRGGSGAAPDEASNPFATDLKLSVAMPQAALLTVVGAACIGAGVIVGTANAPVFFGLLTVGALALCTTTAGVNMSIMASVRPESRSFAIGIGTLLTHALGDVPAPPLIGALAESLSPQTCHVVGAARDALARSRAARVLTAAWSAAGGSGADGSAASVGAGGSALGAAQLCTRDPHGLQLTLVAVTMWLVWPAVLWFVAWLLSEARNAARRRAAAASAGRALGSPSRLAALLTALRGLGLRPLEQLSAVARRAAAATLSSFRDVGARVRGRTGSPDGVFEEMPTDEAHL